MLGSTRKLRVHAHREPVDMRKSFHTLSAVVKVALGRDVLEGDLFLFVGRDRKRAKVLFFDGTGLCLFCKVLSVGRFPAPWESDDSMTLTQTELALFLEGAQVLGRLSPPPLEPADLRVSDEDFR